MMIIITINVIIIIPFFVLVRTKIAIFSIQNIQFDKRWK